MNQSTWDCIQVQYPLYIYILHIAKLTQKKMKLLLEREKIANRPEIDAIVIDCSRGDSCSGEEHKMCVTVALQHEYEHLQFTCDCQ